ncbi:MAG: hypothetical protein V3W08_05985 [Candidatus Binatia bacterium]
MKTIRPFLAAVLLAGALGLSLLLLSSGSLHAETIRVTENLRGEPVILPPSAPRTDRLVLVSFFTITAEAEIIAGMALYDNPRSGRPANYIELFDSAGGLLMVSWVDKFGIRRTAIDRGLLQEEASGLKGDLVLLLEGDPV